MTNDDNGWSFKLYKTTKALHDLMNMEMRDNPPHMFKEKIKLEFRSIKSVCRKFPCGTAGLTTVLEQHGKTFEKWCGMSKENQEKFELLGDNVT